MPKKPNKQTPPRHSERSRGIPPDIIITILILALLIRLICLYPQFSGDVKNHLVWGSSALANPVGFFARHFPGYNDPNYPTVSIYLFAFSKFVYDIFVSFFSYLNHTIPLFPSFLVPLFESQNMQMGFMKLPAIFADVGIGLFLYKIFEKLKYKKPLLLTSLFLFNPAIIYISAVWGQIESVTLLPLVISLYFALLGDSRHKYLSLFFFAVAALTKQTALWFTPLYLFLWYKEINFGEWVRGVIASLTILFISYLPFGLTPIPALKNYFSTLSGSSDYVSDAAYNLWWFFYPTPTSDSVMLGPVSIRVVSITLLLLCLAIILRSLFKNYSTRSFFNALFIWSLAVFFLQTRVHERHLAPALMFVLFTPGLYSRFFLDYLLLSAYHFYNLYTILKLPFV